MSITIYPASAETITGMLARISEQVEEVSERDDWSFQLTYLVNLVLEEFGLNALTHGMRNGLDWLSMIVRSDQEKVVIELIDDGAKFDPLTDAPKPDSQLPIEGREVGGLGIHLILNMVEKAYYERADNRNCLTLVTGRS